MECNREEAIRARDIAHKLFSKNDYVGAKKFGDKAQRLYPNLDGIQHAVTMFNVYRSANNKINGKCVPDWYGVLGITALASCQRTVNTQYRKLALLLHPDKNECQGAEEGFKILLQAKDILSDSVERSLYDQTILSEIFLVLLLPDTWNETGKYSSICPFASRFHS
ncbi:Chaperone protein dnaJ A6 [Cardamine amara subsp. amara]|uniref:Chaperone protein dnaJ A6 n=1 Tax=Cardamine amara subsp. amara TaxID=228776 RepID=A0ABD1BL22_CARAN